MHRAKVIREDSTLIPGILTTVRILPMKSEGLKAGDFSFRPLRSCKLKNKGTSQEVLLVDALHRALVCLFGKAKIFERFVSDSDHVPCG
jgi:hypothetical protein